MKQVVNFRLNQESVKSLDEWAASRNISRTAMLEIVLWAERERQKPISEREYFSGEKVISLFCEHGAAPGLCKVAKCR